MSSDTKSGDPVVKRGPGRPPGAKNKPGRLASHGVSQEIVELRHDLAMAIHQCRQQGGSCQGVTVCIDGTCRTLSLRKAQPLLPGQ